MIFFKVNISLKVKTKTIPEDTNCYRNIHIYYSVLNSL